MSARISSLAILIVASSLRAEPTIGVTTLAHEGIVNSIAFSPDGKTLAVVGERRDKTGEIILWDVATARPVMRLFGHDSIVDKVVFAPDGRSLATMNSNHLMIWELPGGKLRSITPRGIFLGRQGPGQIVDGSLKHWDLAGRKRSTPWRIPGEYVYQVHSRSALSADGEQIAFVVSGARVAIVNLATLSERIIFPMEAAGGEVECLSMSPDKQTLAVGCTGGLTLWDLTRGQLRRALILAGKGDGEADC